jgi:hypothetical protein
VATRSTILQLPVSSFSGLIFAWYASLTGAKQLEAMMMSSLNGTSSAQSA